MPRKQIDYSNTHFYKIVCKDTNITECYVGHTTDFVKRRYAHKNICYKEEDRHYNIYLYEFIRENGGWDNWEMINIETRSCRDSLEAKTIERELTEQLKANLNRVKAIETKEEKSVRKKIWRDNNPEYNKQYYQDHKEEHNARSKQYREDHKEEIQEWKKKHYEENKEDILTKQKEKYEENKEIILERNKKWRDEHREEQKEYHKQYRENNKEKVAERKKKCVEKKKDEYLQKKRDYYQSKKEKQLCECGSMVSSCEKSRHLKSQKHQTYLKQQQEI